VTPADDPQANLDAVLRVLAEDGADDYTQLCTVWCAWSESDMRNNVSQAGVVNVPHGVFQHTKYWDDHDHTDVAACTRAFLAVFKRIARPDSKAVHLWLTQRWLVPGSNYPDPGAGFLTAVETVNYFNHLPAVADIIKTGRLP